MTKEPQELLTPAAGVGVLMFVVAIAFYFSGANTQAPETSAGSPTTIGTAYTKTTANIRECASTSTCKVVGTYPPDTNVDISSYGVSDVSQLPDWVSFTYPAADGSFVTGYINKVVLSDTQTSATSDSGPSSSSSNEDANQAQTTTENQAQQPSAAPHAKSLSSLIKEWRPSTAYVECYWDYPGSTKWYYKQSGSGLLVNFSSVPTVATNRHVVYSTQYGLPQECDVAFPDDKYVFYSIHTIDEPAHPSLIPGGPVIPATPANGQLQFTTSGSDVAYLSGFKENNIGYDYTPPKSLQQRAKGGSFACTSSPNIGDPVVILGYPVYGSSIASVLSTIEITATEGIISGDDGDYYTTSAKIDHGNSGGLAIDTTNDCYMGIPTASYSGSIESLGRILPVSFVVKF